MKTELMAFRLPEDLAAMIRAQATGDNTITDVVIRMLRAAPARLNYVEHRDGAKPRRQSKKEQVVEALRSSDVTAEKVGREDIEYGLHTELPIGPNVATLDAVGPAVACGRGKATVETVRPKFVNRMREKGDKSR